jgi:hypothetical protein
MKGGGIVDGLYSLLFIVAIVGSIVLGGLLVIRYYDPQKTTPPPGDKPKPTPEPNPKPYQPGWGPGPWGPDPWDPNYTPDIPGVPDPKPPPPAPSDNFKPVLTLLDAKYDTVNRQVLVNYKILPNGSVPPSKSYSIEFDVLVNGKAVSQIPEPEPLASSEMTGLQQQALVSVTGAPPDVKVDEMTLSGQIHFRENGTVNTGVIGVPVIVKVK